MSSLQYYQWKDEQKCTTLSYTSWSFRHRKRQQVVPIGNLGDVYEYQNEDCPGRVEFKTHNWLGVEVRIGFKQRS